MILFHSNRIQIQRTLGKVFLPYDIFALDGISYKEIAVEWYYHGQYLLSLSVRNGLKEYS